MPERRGVVLDEECVAQNERPLGIAAVANTQIKHGEGQENIKRRIDFEAAADEKSPDVDRAVPHVFVEQ